MFVLQNVLQIILPDMNGVTTSLYHDTRTKKKSGKYPVKLQVTYRRKHRRYSTTVDLTVNEFSMLHATNRTYKFMKGDTLTRKSIKDSLGILNEIETKAKNIIIGLTDATFVNLKTELQGKGSSDGSVYALYDEHAEKLNKSGNIGTSVWYLCSKNSLRSFKDKLLFKEVSVAFLSKYEQWMLENGRSMTSVSMYIRALRAMYNRASKKDVSLKDMYPFGDGDNKYQIPTSRSVKKALPIEQIGMIYNYPTILNSSEDKARDFWYFSYLCNGINMMDIAHLKYKNIHGSEIIFNRKKPLIQKEMTQLQLRFH